MDPNDPQDDTAALRRLRWQCRRGMLELDYLFLRFLDLGWGDLDEAARADFARLLTCQDQDLQNWILSRSQPPDGALAVLVRRIVAVAGERPAD